MGVAQGPTADRPGDHCPTVPSLAPPGRYRVLGVRLSTFCTVTAILPLGEGSLSALPAGSTFCPQAGGWGAPAPQMEAGKAGRVFARSGRVNGCKAGRHAEGLDGWGVQSVTFQADRETSQCWPNNYEAPNGDYYGSSWWGCPCHGLGAATPHRPQAGHDARTRQAAVGPIALSAHRPQGCCPYWGWGTEGSGMVVQPVPFLAAMPLLKYGP